MRTFIQAAITMLLLTFTLGKAAADGLCNLPATQFSGMSEPVPNVNGVTEQYFIYLELGSDNKVRGKFQRHEIVFDEKNRRHNIIRERHFFDLDKCSKSDYRIRSSDIDGYLQFANINKSLNEITLTGSIYTYSDGILGDITWLIEGAREMINYPAAPTYDLTKTPIRLKQHFN